MYTTVDIPLKLIPDVIKAIKSSDQGENNNRMKFSIVDGEWNFDGLICCISDLKKFKDNSEEKAKHNTDMFSFL